MKIADVYGGCVRGGLMDDDEGGGVDSHEDGKPKCVIIVAEGASPEMAARDLKLQLGLL